MKAMTMDENKHEAATTDGIYLHFWHHAAMKSQAKSSGARPSEEHPIFRDEGPTQFATLNCCLIANGATLMLDHFQHQSSKYQSGSYHDVLGRVGASPLRRGDHDAFLLSFTIGMLCA